MVRSERFGLTVPVIVSAVRRASSLLMTGHQKRERMNEVSAFDQLKRLKSFFRYEAAPFVKYQLRSA